MKSQTKTDDQQRGSVIITTAIAMSLIVICLIGVELGYLYFMKRELQKTADLAALAGAKDLLNADCTTAKTAAKNNANIGANSNMPKGFTPLIDSEIECGTWSSTAAASDPSSRFNNPANNISNPNAVRISISRPASILPFFGGNREIQAVAVAAQALPRASLSIRNTLATLNSQQSEILNAVFNSLLGGGLQLGVVGWNGFLKTNVNILSYLDLMATKLNISAGQYDEVLNSEVTIGSMIEGLIEALEKDGNIATASLAAINSQRAQLTAGSAQIRLRELLSIATGTPKAALDLNIQAFQIVQGAVQLANGEHTAIVDVPLGNVFGLATANAKIRVGEKMQFSAIGNPDLVNGEATDTNRIYVRTAQIRAVASVSIPGLSTVTNLLDASTALLQPLTSLLSTVLSLDLRCVLSCTQNEAKIVLTPTSPAKLNVAIDLASSESWINDHTCGIGAQKTILTTQNTAASNIYVGQMTNTQVDAFLGSNTQPTINAFPIFDVEVRECRKSLLGIISSCDNWSKYSRTGLTINSPVLAKAGSKTFIAPLDIDDHSKEPEYAQIGVSDVLSGLPSTLSGVKLQTFAYDSSKNNSLGNTISLATNLIGVALSAVSNLISTLLSPIDVLVNYLLDALGVRLATAETSARLTCGKGAELVY